MTCLLVMYIGGGLILGGLSIPLILGKIKPNPWYGFRVQSTLKNIELWYAVNSYAGKRLFVAGVVDIVAATVFYFVPGLTVDEYAYLCLSVLGITLAIATIQSFIYLNAQK